MNLITFPIKPNDVGGSVKDLQNALLSIAMKLGTAKFGELLKDTKFLKNWTIDFNSSTYGEATEDAVKLFQREQMAVKPSGTVNKATASAINNLLGNKGQEKGSKGTAPAAPVLASGNTRKSSQASSDPDAPFKVYGIVYDQWIEPMECVPVMVFVKGMRSEHLLAEGKTDERGNYSITYSKDKLTKDDAGGANLVVKVYGSDGEPICTSPVNYNAASQLQVNINLGPRAYMGPSAFVN